MLRPRFRPSPTLKRVTVVHPSHSVRWASWRAPIQSARRLPLPQLEVITVVSVCAVCFALLRAWKKGVVCGKGVSKDETCRARLRL